MRRDHHPESGPRNGSGLPVPVNGVRAVRETLSPIAPKNGMDFLPYRLYPIYISVEIDAG
jgi:hypothetical protein